MIGALKPFIARSVGAAAKIGPEPMTQLGGRVEQDEGTGDEERMAAARPGRLMRSVGTGRGRHTAGSPGPRSASWC